MKDFSLIEKLQLLMNVVATSPLFLFCSMLGIAVLIFYIINIKKEKKINKWIFVSIWGLLALILVINYNSVVLSLIDNLLDGIFKTIYFPNLAIYIVLLIISNVSFFYSIFSEKINKKNRISNFVEALIVDILLIFIIDIVQKNNINVYDELSIYSNSNLLVLLELTSSIFISWILVNLLISAHEKLKKYDKKEYPSMPEIIFEDIK